MTKDPIKDLFKLCSSLEQIIKLPVQKTKKGGHKKQVKQKNTKKVVISRYFENEPVVEDYLSNFDKFIVNLNAYFVLFLIIVFFFLSLNSSFLFQITIIGIFTFIVISYISSNKYKKYINDVDLYKEQVHKQQKEFWTSMDGWTFEDELAKLYRTLGYNAKVTKGSGDGGVDIVLEEDEEIIYVQCKAYKNKIGPAPVRELYGVMVADDIDQGVLACLGGFTKGAIEFAEENNIELVDIEDIIEMSFNIKNKTNRQIELC